MEGSGEGADGMTATEWRVATALFTAGEVSATRGGPGSQTAKSLQHDVKLRVVDVRSKKATGTMLVWTANAYTQLA